MNIRDRARTLTMASLLALALLSVPAGLAHAAPKSTAEAICRAQGFAYDPALGCADNFCINPDGGAAVSPGTAYVHKGTQYMCNGFTGLWDKVGGRTQTTTTGRTGTPVPPVNN